MADEADCAQAHVEMLDRYVIGAARAKAAQPMEPGAPGECDYCGEHSPRLVRGACARCRDRLGLP